MSARPLLKFVDTNILVYAYDQSAGDKHLRAKSLVTGLVHSPQPADVLADVRVKNPFLVTDAVAPSSYN